MLTAVPELMMSRNEDRSTASSMNGLCSYDDVRKMHLSSDNRYEISLNDMWIKHDVCFEHMVSFIIPACSSMYLDINISLLTMIPSYAGR